MPSAKNKGCAGDLQCDNSSKKEGVSYEDRLSSYFNSSNQDLRGFARDLAHAVSNPLQGMVLHVDLLRSAVAKDKRAKQYVERIAQGIERITELLKHVTSL